MGRAAACGAVTWFAVLRNFELMKNGPSVGKNRWSRFFCLSPQPSCVVGGQALAIAPPCRSAPTFMIVARSWALISKPASISRRRTISAAASGYRIGTGKSSLSKRSTSTCCGVSSDVIDDRGRLRHQLFRIAVLARAFRSRRYRSGIVTNLYAADKIKVASSA
jgi:hypothetical protein